VYDFEEVQTTSASGEAVWAVYADVTGWPRWNAAIQTATLTGPFQSGASGHVTVSLVTAQTVPFHIENVEPLKAFDVVWTVGPFLKTRMTHTLERTGAETRFKHAYHTGGVMAPFGFLQASLAHSRVRPAMVRIAQLAEGRP
jgi:Polyketide cyclase / dehydrase and lipid transport